MQWTEEVLSQYLVHSSHFYVYSEAYRQTRCKTRCDVLAQGGGDLRQNLDASLAN